MGCCESREPLFKLKDNYEAAATMAETPHSSGSIQSLKSNQFIKIDIKNFIRKNNMPLEETYTIERDLGQGTYGFVRQALHKPSGFRRAIKTIVKRGNYKPNETQMLMELEMLRRADHPNILRAYELFEDERNFHLVTELCTGGELFDRILSWDRPSENMVAKIFYQIISAVAYCHDRNIIHRDIKPENMLFSGVEEESLIKIIDFGVSCLFTEGEKFSTKYGTVRPMQPFYIAPEVLKKCYNEKCDIWSCGVVLYVMLCGCPPFGGKSNQEIIRSVLHGNVVFYCKRHAAPDWDPISRDVKELIAWMLTYDPSIRPSAKDIIQHPWIQQRVFEDVQDNPLAESLMLNLAKFRAEQRFQYAVLSYIASQLMTNHEIENLAKFFSECDKNKDGRLSPDEIKQGFVKSGLMADINLIMSECDADYDGFIDYTEFLTATINWKASMSDKRLEAAFQAFDINHDGKISFDELKALFDNQDEVEDEIWMSLLDEADTNKDGVIDLEEFKQTMLRHSVKQQPAAIKLF